ncbi:MAG: hypothetical protein QXM31_02980 [Candidatus Woesearchaeota archaeon]
MAEEGKGLALVILGIVAVIAVVGLVLLFTRGGATGNYVVESTFVQFEPKEACANIGCMLIGVEGAAGSYATRGPLLAVCDCAGQQVATPIVRQYDWRQEFYPQE